MTNYIKQYLQSFGVAVNVQDISVQPLPQDIKQLDIPFAGGQSFQVVADYVFNLELCGYTDLGYVLGYGLDIIPVERAIIRIGDKYYDPEEVNDHFASVWELSADQLTEFVATNHKPPGFRDWIKQCKAID